MNRLDVAFAFPREFAPFPMPPGKGFQLPRLAFALQLSNPSGRFLQREQLERLVDCLPVNAGCTNKRFQVADTALAQAFRFAPRLTLAKGSTLPHVRALSRNPRQTDLLETLPTVNP